MSNIKTGDILNFGYTGAVQSVTLPKGTYKLECWGAQGGDHFNYASQYRTTVGGYSVGTITLSKTTNIYIYVGGAGTYSSGSGGAALGGFNGGGYAYSSNRQTNSGGGATDIRISQDSLYARVIVAGGAGAGRDSSSNSYATSKGVSSGGGLSGIGGNYYSDSTFGTGRGGRPGTQTAAGENGVCQNSETLIAAGFGFGGFTAVNSTYGVGGGGGWYGGGAGSADSNGGGGSGYVYTSSTASNYPSGCLLNSSYYLSDAKTIAGNTSFTSPTGSSETGHSGNGYCRITVIECKNTALYTRINNSMKKATAFYFKLNNNKMYGVGSANSNPQNSTIMNFTYTGSVQTTTLVPGEYKFECWGASGGDAANATYNGGTGGKGGYSFGILKVSNTSKYYIIVGGQGQSYNTSLSKSYAGAGGFGGGGAGGAAWMSGNVSGGSGGGGLSGIFKSATYNGNEIIIAGGGGAGGGSGYINPVLKNSNLIAGDQSFPSPTGGTETGHSGNGYVRITKLTDIIYLTHAKNDIMDFNYTGSVQSKTLKPGTYTIECWGGQGGSYNSYIGGYGGYSKGTITLTKTTTVYVSVGGAGSSSSTAAGFNGGGTGISSGRGGGGATDVRIGQNSLYSRVIVAGGGGGAGVTSANANPCGCGGGEYGGDGYYNDTTGSYTIGQNRCGGSASQTAGGKTWSTSTQATFGQGGNASGYSCGGGGGGWYGGGGAYDSDSDSDGRWGGGGSGYVYTSSTAKNYPNGCLLNSTHYLTNAQTIAGNTSFISPTGSAETGHTGSGFCRITNLNPTQYGLYVKTNSGWKHIDL